jgi:hypothetical protein
MPDLQLTMMNSGSDPPMAGNCLIGHTNPPEKLEITKHPHWLHLHAISDSNSKNIKQALEA